MLEREIEVEEVEEGMVDQVEDKVEQVTRRTKRGSKRV